MTTKIKCDPYHDKNTIYILATWISGEMRVNAASLARFLPQDNSRKAKVYHMLVTPNNSIVQHPTITKLHEDVVWLEYLCHMSHVLCSSFLITYYSCTVH